MADTLETRIRALSATWREQERVWTARLCERVDSHEQSARLHSSAALARQHADALDAALAASDPPETPTGTLTMQPAGTITTVPSLTITAAGGAR